MDTPVPTYAKMDDEKEASKKQEAEAYRWRWTPEKVYHWVLAFTAAGYAMWSYATNEEKTFLVDQMHGAFRESPYGLPQKQDMTNWGWRTTTYVVTTMWKWYLLHPVLGRATAYIAPSLVPVFYAAYSSLFVTFSFGWEVTLLFLGQHAAFYAAAASHFPSLCYVAAIVIHCQKFVLPYDPFEYMYPRYGLMPYRAAFVAFHWNLMRGLSFSLDFVRAKRQKHSDENKSRWPPYWQSLAYFIYLPTMYLGPPQNYDDFVAEFGDVRMAMDRRETRPIQPGGLRPISAISLLHALPVHLRLCRRLGQRGRCRGPATLSMHSHNAPVLALLEVLRPRHAQVDPEGRYLASAERMRVAKAFLGSPHFLLTICACIFHLAELEVCLIICRRVLTGFPFPIVPILVVLYSACHVALDVAEWEASAIAKQKQASS
ncbi:uncharacterized protein LOC119458142 isoform X9 [Dermacentor silvarum]|uniref:uncharacterized protein LOC119458142 isoform X9 n=1 Tax=Dermacentor silvarum TaxID=543639 RepID=UPI0021013449|nr:uncharacterized protein LOC119458142 isoform X9 [Dermacentor silvarum]